MGDLPWWTPTLAAVLTAALIWWLEGPGAGRGNGASGVSESRRELERIRAEARRKFWEGPGEPLVLVAALAVPIILFLCLIAIIAALG